MPAREIHTRMRRNTIDHQLKVPNTLARRLVGEPLRWLQHKHRLRLACQPLRVRTRNFAANFLIRIQQQCHRSVQRIQLSQRGDCLQRHHHTGLHVHNARPHQPYAVLGLHFAPRHRREGSHRIHRVQMSEQQRGLVVPLSLRISTRRHRRTLRPDAAEPRRRALAPNRQPDPPRGSPPRDHHSETQSPPARAAAPAIAVQHRVPSPSISVSAPGNCTFALAGRCFTPIVPEAQEPSQPQDRPSESRSAH